MAIGTTTCLIVMGVSSVALALSLPFPAAALPPLSFAWPVAFSLPVPVELLVVLGEAVLPPPSAATEVDTASLVLLLLLLLMPLLDAVLDEAAVEVAVDAAVLELLAVATVVEPTELEGDEAAVVDAVEDIDVVWDATALDEPAAADELEAGGALEDVVLPGAGGTCGKSSASMSCEPPTCGSTSRWPVAPTRIRTVPPWGPARIWCFRMSLPEAPTSSATTSGISACPVRGAPA